MATAPHLPGRKKAKDGAEPTKKRTKITVTSKAAAHVEAEAASPAANEAPAEVEPAAPAEVESVPAVQKQHTRNKKKVNDVEVQFVGASPRTPRTRAAAAREATAPTLEPGTSKRY